MPNRTATFSPTEAQALAAMRVILNRRFRIPVWPIVVFAPLIALGFLLYGGEGRFTGLLPTLAWLVLILSGVVAAAYYWLLPRQVRRSFRQTALLQEPITIEWDGEGYGLLSQRGRSQLRWTDLYAWAERDGLFLLLQSEMLYNLVPHAALAPDQVEDLRQCLAQSGLKRL